MLRRVPHRLKAMCPINERVSMSNEQIITYYSQQKVEVFRLFKEEGIIERIRTENILQRYLPSPPEVIVDVGGATGPYSILLAKKGYRVHLVDLVPFHIEEAKKNAHLARINLESLQVGDARDLNFPDQSVGAILLLGPLYHLPKKEDRDRALQEAYRLLKPGGKLFAAAISRYAPFSHGMLKNICSDERFKNFLAKILENGCHAGDNDIYFTTSYMHKPEELEKEIKDNGFSKVQVLGVEGTAWLFPHLPQLMQDDTERQFILATLEKLEREPSFIGASSHLLAIATKP